MPLGDGGRRASISTHTHLWCVGALIFVSLCGDTLFNSLNNINSREYPGVGESDSNTEKSLVLRIFQMLRTNMERASAWSVTVNNPIAADEENMNLARQRGWKVEGQLERGANGTPHYQLLVRTPQVRFSAVKKAFPRAHIEVARNAAALEQYVHKEETKEGDLKEQSSMYPSLAKFWDLIAEELRQEWWAEYCWSVGDELPQENRWFSLTKFDYICNQLIREGYHIETIAVNPQTRSAWKIFGRSIIIRSHRRQPDRQTDYNAVASIDIPNALSSSSNEEEAPPPGTQARRRSL